MIKAMEGMEMNKLELKHIAPYLPYGLRAEMLSYKCDYVGERYDTIKGLYSFGGYWYCNTDKGSTPGLSEIRPILRPLSDLTKKIEINGDVFIPIIELLKIKYKDYYNENYNNKYRRITSNKEGYPHAWFDYSANRAIMINLCDLENLPKWIIDKLYEWHFAIDIPEELFIDINTL